MDRHGATRAGSLETGTGSRLALLAMLTLLALEIPADLRRRERRFFVPFTVLSLASRSKIKLGR